MWQLQWIFSLIPDAWLQIAVHVIVALGIALTLVGSFGKNFLVVDAYSTVIKHTGILLLLIGVFFEGSYATEMSWRAKTAADKAEIERLDKLVKEAEAKSDQFNKELEAKVKTKVKVVREVQTVIQERIKEVEKRIDAACKVEPDAIKILNDSARNIKGEGK